MQTFLPYPDFYASAHVLDDKRLGKQRVEAKQLLVALGFTVGEHAGNRESSWANHPAAEMWRGYEWALAQYGASICGEWIRRGFSDSLQPQFARVYTQHPRYFQHGHSLPEWLGWSTFHVSHQSNLVRKNKEFYGPLFPGVPDNLPYIWPSRAMKSGLLMGYTTGMKQIDTTH
jgi:hypothetical protein